MVTSRVHGGEDERGGVLWDFSSNSNSAGPCPVAREAVQLANPGHYPDPNYTQLRVALAAHHGVDADRVLIAASASEFIQRVTAWSSRGGGKYYWTPKHAYGDYAHAATSWGLSKLESPERANLVWLCDPSSPLGQTLCVDELKFLSPKSPCTTVLDCAYMPLRLEGECLHEARVLDQVWQLWSPNKALGLTGVRGAYVIAPVGSHSLVMELETLSASWPLGVHGQAMLLAWTLEDTQAWVNGSKTLLKEWKEALMLSLEQLGWFCQWSQSHYFCAKPPEKILSTDLRRFDIKLRDASSFGLPGLWRLSAQKPEAIFALEHALKSIQSQVNIK